MPLKFSARPADRGARSAAAASRRGDDRAARRQRGFYKIGYQLAFAGGLPLAAGLDRSRQASLLDLKLHDIGNTVAQRRREHRQTRRDLPHRARLSADHEGGGRGTRGSGLKILAVTVLTSYDDGDLARRRLRAQRVRPGGRPRRSRRRCSASTALVCSAGGGGGPAQDRRVTRCAGDARHPAGRDRPPATRNAS